MGREIKKQKQLQAKQKFAVEFRYIKDNDVLLLHEITLNTGYLSGETITTKYIMSYETKAGKILPLYKDEYGNIADTLTVFVSSAILTSLGMDGNDVLINGIRINTQDQSARNDLRLIIYNVLRISNYSIVNSDNFEGTQNKIFRLNKSFKRILKRLEEKERPLSTIFNSYGRNTENLNFYPESNKEKIIH